MKIGKRTKISLVPLLLVTGSSYLLWPLAAEEKFKIIWDDEKIAFKEQYLAQLSPNDSVERPNIIEDVKFTEGYVKSPICSPSRAGLLTRRYQQRVGFEVQPHDRYPHNMMEFPGFKYPIKTDGSNLADLEEISYPSQEEIDKQGLPPSEIALGELLKPMGDNTTMIGKTQWVTNG